MVGSVQLFDLQGVLARSYSDRAVAAVFTCALTGSALSEAVGTGSLGML